MPAKHKRDDIVKIQDAMEAAGKTNMDAWLVSGQIWGTGLQEMSREIAGIMQDAMTGTIGSIMAFDAAMPLKSAFDIQIQMARASMETAAQISRVMIASVKLTEQAMAPVAESVRLTVGAAIKPD